MLLRSAVCADHRPVLPVLRASLRDPGAGGFVLLVISSAVIFLLWYSFTRDAFQIQPLVPALKSWWMKLHVPANFIGYGKFSLRSEEHTSELKSLMRISYAVFCLK